MKRKKHLDHHFGTLPMLKDFSLGTQLGPAPFGKMLKGYSKFLCILAGSSRFETSTLVKASEPLANAKNAEIQIFAFSRGPLCLRQAPEGQGFFETTLPTRKESQRDLPFSL